MKRFFLLWISLFLLGGGHLLAQEDYRISAGGKTIMFKEIDRLTITGTTGSEMIISRDSNTKVDKRADGLRLISPSGRTDNTGFGVSVTERDGGIMVEQVGGKNGRITVQIPNSAVVEVEQSSYRGGNLMVSDFSGELDVSMHYNRVKLDNVMGPIAINTIYGGITAVFPKAPTEDVRLHSSYSDVDLSIPSATKANVSLSTSYGSMYTDFDITVEANSSGSRSGKLIGTINGGGKKISLTATYDDIYLRKK